MATGDARLAARLDAIEAQQAVILAGQAADRDERREMGEKIAYLFVSFESMLRAAGVPIPGVPAAEPPAPPPPRTSLHVVREAS